MEDTYFVGELSGLPAQGSSAEGMGPQHLAATAVFDGHGGSAVSDYCAKHFQQRAASCIRHAFTGSSVVDFHDAVLTGLRGAFLALDRELGKEAHLCGTTATACVISEDQIYIASCGRCN
jgi:serine/threonine protein phosphatase PrpC